MGKALVKGLLAAGMEPVPLVKREADVDEYAKIGLTAICRDISFEEACAGAFAGCTAVVHCAARTRDFGRWEDFRRYNMETTRNVMRAAAKDGVGRVIHISTTSVYGNERNHFGTDEEADYGQRVVDPYSRSKILADKIVIGMIEEESLPAVVLRFGNIWGPGDQNILPFIVSSLKGRRLMIEGDGSNVLSLTYIDNAIAAILLALEGIGCLGKIYNITDGGKVTSKKFITDIISALGITYRLRNIPYPLLYTTAYMLEQYYLFTRRETKPPLTRFAARILKYDAIFDISRAMTELGYEPRVSYKEAMAHTTPYIRSLYYGRG